jgi:ABC-type transport system involved in multi-copper enzyme maturation permease subunit
MFGEILRFEVRYHLRQPLFWLVTAICGLMTFGAVVSDSVTIGGAIGNVHRNAPFVIIQLLTVVGVIIGTFVTTAFVASAVHRDVDYGTSELFFSRPIKKAHYLFGRFSGSLLVSAMVFIGPALGILIGSLMPWIEPERLGATTAGPYIFSMLVMVLPNLIFTGALFFTLAALTRSLLSTYLGVVGFMTLFFISQAMLRDVENQAVASLADPFGMAPFELATRYWTVVERNSELPEIAGSLLWNRLLWIGLGLAVLAIAYALFRPSSEPLSWRRSRRPTAAAAEPPAAFLSVSVAPRPRSPQDFSPRTAWRQLAHQIRIEVLGVLRSVPFLVMLAFGLFNVLGGLAVSTTRFGTTFYPVTHEMLSHLEGSYAFLLVIIVTFYAGELVWRERALKMAEVQDAMPVPNWVPLIAKLIALWAVISSFAVVGAFATMGFQAWHGYTHFEPLLYAKGLLVMTGGFLLTAVLAVFLQVLANSKFIGFGLMILYMISATVLNALHFEHNLYQFAGHPAAPYSDMNGYGHFVAPLVWFHLYWAFFCLLLAVAASLFWVRGTGHSWATRGALAKARFARPAPAIAAIALLGFLGTGTWIYYNTNVLNKYVPSNVARDRQAAYEKKYRQYQNLVMPRIVAVKSEVDIYPRERRVEGRATYALVNKTDAPIRDLHVGIDPRVEIVAIDLPPHRIKSADAEQGYTIYELAEPMAPGASFDLRVTVRRTNPGFENNGSDTSFVYNGTFFNNMQMFPNLGYEAGRELQDRNERRKRDLPPAIRMPKIDDEAARRNTYLAADSDWIRYEATVSTDADQVALAPGYLEREWQEGGRRYFHYTMDAPILHFYSFLSARWEVARDTWRGPVSAGAARDAMGNELAVNIEAMPTDVAIEVYYQPGHEMNVPRMIDSVKKSLTYFTTHFSPYQHRQVRIIEFPNYASFAQSFPNTIPYSEAIGFIADLRDEDSIDYVFYVTAHEVAHQWWAHQVIGANVQGSTMMSESFAQYSALMVMEQEYGREKMRRFLKYELDNYLRSRGGELVEELPLMLVENQGYIHYRKGSVVLYALRDYLGADVVNQTLARYVSQVAYQPPPFTTSRDFMALLRAAAPADKQAMITDIFEKITLFENKVVSAKATKRADGKYDVDLVLATKKAYADGQGVESETPIDDWIDVGVFAKKAKAADGKPAAKDDETVLYLEKHHLKGGETTLQLVVDGEPAEAGVDPYNKLVDRNSDDNRKSVEVGG